jgi:fructose-1,6-bisphosphatase/inositol monophosphatase family enzyme
MVSPLEPNLQNFTLLDGTTNFAHGYPSFSVSIGVLFRGKPAASTVVSVCSYCSWTI